MRTHIMGYASLAGLCLLGVMFIFVKGVAADNEHPMVNGSVSPTWVYTSHAKIAVEVIGEGKQTIFFVHGFGLTRNAWRKVANILARAGVRSVIWDLSGHGESCRLTDNVTVEGHAKDLIDIINFFKEKDSIVVGHSYGGIIAQQALALDDRRIKTLGLVSSWSGKLPEEQADKLRKRFELVMLLAPLIRLLPKIILPDYTNEFFQSPLLNDRKDLEACLNGGLYNPAIIPQMIAILHGKSDYTIPSELGKRSATILNGQYVEIDTIAHQLPQTHPLETANFILEYLLKKK